MRVAGIIPARFNSTRLPGKPLMDINGKTLIIRVLEQCSKVDLLDEIVVATDDERILEHVQNAGYKSVMTSADHGTGTERCDEALGKLDGEFDFVINIQGDEPFINPDHISALIEVLNMEVDIATLCMPIVEENDLTDVNVPKLVLNKDNEVLYFSRSLIPFPRDNEKIKIEDGIGHLKHIGIYAYRKDVLATIVDLPASDIEKIEQLEQLRWLFHGLKIKAEKVDFEESISVDTKMDLEKARQIASKMQ